MDTITNTAAGVNVNGGGGSGGTEDTFGDRILEVGGVTAVAKVKGGGSSLMMTNAVGTEKMTPARNAAHQSMLKELKQFLR